MPNGGGVPAAARSEYCSRRGARLRPTAGKAPKKTPNKTARKPVLAAGQVNPGLELLFEVGSEEIPAGMIAKAAEDLKSYLQKLLVGESLGTDIAVESFGGPRRLTIWARNLSAKQPDVTSEVTGPPKSVAYDNVGEPTR